MRWIEFECGEGQCIDLELYCDGFVHCSTGKDEIDCSAWNSHFTNFRKSLTFFNTACREFDFKCENGLCINIDRRCDGVESCDGEDERDCPRTVFGKVIICSLKMAVFHTV